MNSAIVIAAIMEFSGAFLLGGNVASKIMKGIANADDFAEQPEVLMFGMMCVVIGVAASISPIAVTTQNVIDSIAMTVMSLLVYVFSLKEKRIKKFHGVIMLLVYVGFIVYTCMR